MRNESRPLQALALKRGGKTLAEIGVQLNVSTTRAGQLVNKGKYFEGRRTYWYDGLPPHVVSALRSAGYESKQAVLDDILAGTIHYPRSVLTGSGIPRLGRKGFEGLCVWAGLKQSGDTSSSVDVAKNLYVRLVVASRSGKGLFLSRDDCKVLAEDDRVLAAALAAAEGGGFDIDMQGYLVPLTTAKLSTNDA